VPSLIIYYKYETNSQHHLTAVDCPHAINKHQDIIELLSEPDISYVHLFWPAVTEQEANS
jgi:hypothetical protein